MFPHFPDNDDEHGDDYDDDDGDDNAGDVLIMLIIMTLMVSIEFISINANPITAQSPNPLQIIWRTM